MAIGLVLVGMAALAVWTGLRHRDTPFWKPEPIATSTGAHAVPGEPEPGASRVMHDSEGGALARARETDPSVRARTIIEGSGSDIRSTARMHARRGLIVNVEPRDAIVYINGQLIGEARQLSTADQVWEFGEPEGTYRVTVVSSGYRPLRFEVVADQNAADEIAVLRGRLELE